MSHEFEAAPVEGGLTTRQKVIGVIAVLLAVALVVFIVQNTESTNIQWLTFDSEMPLWATVLGSAIVGALLGLIVSWFVRRRRD